MVNNKMNIYNNGKMYFFFSFFSIVENSKKNKYIYICGESKSSYKEREEKGRTHINFTFFYIF